MCSAGLTLSQALFDGIGGAVAGGLISVAVALLVVKRTQKGDRTAADLEAERAVKREREKMSHDAAEKLTLGLQRHGYGLTHGDSSALQEWLIEVIVQQPVLRDPDLKPRLDVLRETVRQRVDVQKRFHTEAAGSLGIVESDSALSLLVEAQQSYLERMIIAMGETFDAHRRSDPLPEWLFSVPHYDSAGEAD